MKKSFYAALMALVAAGGTGAVTVFADQSDRAVLFSGDNVDYASLIPLRCEMKIENILNVNTGDVKVKITINPPTEGRDENYAYYPMTSFSKIVLTRDIPSDQGGGEKELKVWENVNVGDILEFTDEDDFVLGKDYSWNAKVYNGEKSGALNYQYFTVGLSPITPDAPELSADESGDGPVSVKYVCPEEASGSYWSSTPFPEGVHYTKIELYRMEGTYPEYNYIVVDSHDNPSPGDEFTCVDSECKPGSNTYGVRTYTMFGNSKGGEKSIWIGEDAPAKPASISSVELSDGTVQISWDAVTSGYNGGKIDIDKIRYKVWRMKSYYDDDAVLLADDLSENTFNDKLEGVESEMEFYYKVQPDNGVPLGGYNINYIITSRALKVGPATALPFRETFNNGPKLNKGFVYANSTDFGYQFYSSMVTHSRKIEIKEDEEDEGYSFTVVTGVDGGDPDSDEGCDNYFYVEPSPWYKTVISGYLNTVGIDLENAVDPYVSFSYYSIEGSCVVLSVEVNNGTLDDDNQPVWTSVGSVKVDEQFGNGDTEATVAAESSDSPWKSAVFSLKDFVGSKKAKLRVKFEYADPDKGRYPAIIDNLFVEDYPGVADLTATVGDNNEIALAWTLPETADAEGCRYNVYLGEEKIADVETPEYTYVGAEQGESYSFSVEVVYGNGYVSEKSEPVVVEIPLAEFSSGDYTYTVADGNLKAVAFAGEGDATVLPSEVTYKGKTYKVTEAVASLYSGNRVLKNIEIAAELEVIPESFCYGAVALETVTFPATVKTIGEKAFFGNVAIKSIEFPESLEEIGAAAFQNCTALAEVHFASATPPAVGADAFANIAQPCKGYCPAGSEDAYAAVENMKPILFKEMGVDAIFTDGVVSVEYYDMNGARIAEPRDGQPAIARYRFADGRSKTVKVIRNQK